ncbi:hypothetical protein [Rummeliibacillus sp. TYF-LIM-RU47]|uniref:hypothetical protein n=1 Tax=Rummeliibacillus sp. TYF-LIM-RU47 TaxID=2608406 RepID=UPI00123B5A04|nr:hypothetical protein [Rummeliibacillus sp. TYF-LIM-RU47]
MTILNFREEMNEINNLTYFDSTDYLREKPTNGSKVKELIIQAQYLLKQDLKEEEIYILNGALGNLYRINGKQKKAIACLKYCLLYAQKEKSTTKEIITSIRLGEAYKYDNEHGIAIEHFNFAMKLSKENETDEYLDFVLQHKGKCLLELTRLDEAEACFIEAMKLRVKKGKPALIQSTQDALNLLKRIRNEL